MVRKILVTCLAASFASAAPRSLGFVGADTLIGPARYGMERLQAAFVARGWTVAGSGSHYVVARVQPGAPESFTIRHGTHNGAPAVVLEGGDANGLMYAELELAERLSPGPNPFAMVRESAGKPFLAERGISLYTMQRQWFEKRLYDENHWRRYFDRMAEDRLNSLVVIFGYENGGFLAPLYPYFFDVEGFPGVRMVGLTADQQKKNAAAFRRMIELAHERGIAVTAGIWDHIYRGGVQGGGIAGANESVNRPTPGLVWGVTADNLAAYTKAALKEFFETFPGIDAVQFRMHEESGLKKSEMASFWHDVFGIMKAFHPGMPVDLRAKELPDEIIADAQAQGLKARVSTKHWMEQMGLPFHPTHTNTQDQKNRRHGYADLLRYPQTYRVHWQLWSGGTARLMLWADPDYVRRFARQARLYDGNSFEVNEMLATWMLGEPHDAPAREPVNAAWRTSEDPFDRHWAFYRMWGRLTYDPEAGPDVYMGEFQKHFGPAAAPLQQGLAAASRVLPRIVAAAYRYGNFPTTRGWAEMMRQGDLEQFSTLEGSDIEQFESPRAAASRLLKGGATAKRTPEQTSRWFAATADEITRQASTAEKAAGSGAGRELRAALVDLRILAGLARYYSARLGAAVQYNVWKEGGCAAALAQAADLEGRAVEAWRGIVASAGDVYSEDLAFGVHRVGFPRHWKEELAALEQGLAKLKASSAAAQPGGACPQSQAASSDTAPPAVRIVVDGYRVSVRADDVSGVAWMRLRYRHLTQYEDYRTAEMNLNAATGQWEVVIPADFIDPKWNLMFYVEAMDKKGNGRMYPDLELEQPYIIVGVKR